MKSSSPAKTVQADIYDRVTERIVALLEQGVAPWQPSHFAKNLYPRSFQTGQPYRGINVLLLGMQRYASPWWLTFKQAKALGGRIRRGEKGSLVVKYGEYLKENVDQNEENKPRRLGYLKGYVVFNACQIEGIEFPAPPAPEPLAESEQFALARQIVEGMPNPPAIHEGRHVCAFYSPGADSVDTPSRHCFRSYAAFYKTLFHELIHSTGHESRLAREAVMKNEGINAIGDARNLYSQEELVAEIGAAFLAAHAGFLEPDELQDSAAYVQGWLAALKVKENRRWIIGAASKAQRAADFILGQ